jgi:hypothetical protein
MPRVGLTTEVGAMARTNDVSAVVGAAAILVAAAWLDPSVVADAQREGARTFQAAGSMSLTALATIAVAGGCLAVGRLASKVAPLVGLVYAVVGGYFALAPWLIVTLAAERDGAPPILPDPIPSAMTDIYTRTVGPIGAVTILGGAMLIVGLVAMVRPLVGRGRVADAGVVAHGPGVA